MKAALSIVFVGLLVTLPIKQVLAQAEQQGAPLTTAAGQLTLGDLVRVAVGQRPDLSWKTGRFVEVDGETLVFGDARIPLDSIAEIQVYRGTHGHAGAGAALGLLIGGAGGALVGYYKDPGNIYAGLAAVLGGAVGGVLGLFTGIAIGSSIRGQTWRTVPLDQLHVSFTPHHDGRFRLGLSVRF